MTNVRNKKEVIDEARNERRTVHFESLMDVCHQEIGVGAKISKI